MKLQPKHAWYCIVGIFGGLAFFNIFSWPHDSASAMRLLDVIDGAIFRPAAHPTIFAIILGIALGTILLPEIWRVVRDRALPSDSRPDWDLRDAINYLRIRSKWAIGRVYSANENNLLEEDIDEVLRDAASQGRISIWGRPTQTGTAALFSRGTEIKIPFPDLQGMSLDLTTMVHEDAPNGVVLSEHSQDQYRFLRVNQREIFSEWPSAFYGRLFFDKTWKSRKLRIVPDDAKVRETV